MYNLQNAELWRDVLLSLDAVNCEQLTYTWDKCNAIIDNDDNSNNDIASPSRYHLYPIC
jgi:hypothetical protein